MSICRGPGTRHWLLAALPIKPPLDLFSFWLATVPLLPSRFL
jgi:hypothetical protein